MAHVEIQAGALAVELSLLETMMTFSGSFHIPLAHVTNAYVSSPIELGLKLRLFGTGGIGPYLKGGIFTTDRGLIFCDVHGGEDVLVIETRGEQFPRLAFTLESGQDPNEIAHRICQNLG